MCQPKSKGGKRCLRHAKLSQFVSKFVSLKTGASEELVQNTLSELNREGKALNLPAVSGVEVAGLIQKHELRMDVERGINSHDRKMLDKRLQGAKEETKNGVDGSHFYAWKNLLTRVRSKLRTAVLSVGIVGSLAIGITGCSAGIGVNQNHTPAPSVSISASATPSATVTPPTGEAVLTGKTVTDSNGTYATTQLNPNDPAYKYNKTIVDKSATNLFSQKDILAAQKFTVDFIGTQGMDSIAVDNGDAGWNEWKATEAKKYLYPSVISQLTANKDATDRSGIINNDNKNGKPVLVRDGQARIASETLTLNSVEGATVNGYGNILSFSGTDTAVYRTTKANAIASILKANPTLTEAKLKAKYPGLYDNTTPAPEVKDVLTFSYNTLKDSSGAWKIGGYTNSLTSSYINLK